jgi:hypothetical protein
MNIPDIIAEIRKKENDTIGSFATWQLIVLADAYEALEKELKEIDIFVLQHIPQRPLKQRIDILRAGKELCRSERDRLKAEVALLITERDNALARVEHLESLDHP